MDVFVCVFLLWLTTSTCTAQPGSGQGSVSFLPVSTATQPLIMFSTPLPIPSDMPMKPRPPASVTDNVGAFSTVPILPSSLTPSLVSPLTSTLLPPSPLLYTSMDLEPSSTLPMATNVADPQPTASFDESNILPTSTQQPVLFLPPTSILGTSVKSDSLSELSSSAVFLSQSLTSVREDTSTSSSLAELLLPQLTPTPSRQVLTTEALLEFPDLSSTQTGQVVTTSPLSVVTPIISEPSSTSDAVVIVPELASTRVGGIVSSLPVVPPELTLTTLAPSNAAVLNTQSIPGFSELFLSQTTHDFVTTESGILPTPTPSRISASTTEAIPGSTSLQNDVAMTSQPLMLLPQPSLDTSIEPSTTASLYISTTEALMIFPEVTSTQTILQTSQSVILIPDLTPSPSHVTSSSEAMMVLFPQSTLSPSSDEISPLFAQLSSTFISSGITVISTPVKKGETPLSKTSLMDFFFPPVSSTADQSLLFTSSSPQATPTPLQATPTTPQLRPTSVDMLLVPLQTSELATLPISTLVISPSPATQSVSTTPDSTDSIETTDIFIVETTGLSFPVTSLPSVGISSLVLPSLSTSTTQISTSISTAVQSPVDQLTPTSSVPLFLLPLSSSSGVPDELIATPTSSVASRPITVLESISTTSLPSLSQSTIAQTPIPLATPISVSPSATSLLQPPSSSDSDVFLIETSTLSATSSFITMATSAFDDLQTSIDLLVPFQTTTELTFAPTLSPTTAGDGLTISPSPSLQGPSTSRLAITSSSIESDSVISTVLQSSIFTSLPPLSSSAVEAAVLSSTVTEQLLFPTPSALLSLEPSLSTAPLLLISPSSAVVSLDNIIMTSSLSESPPLTTISVLTSSMSSFSLPLSASPITSFSSSQLPLRDSSVIFSFLEPSSSVDASEVQETTTTIEVTSTTQDIVGSTTLTTSVAVMSTSADSLVTVELSPSLSIMPAPSSTIIQPALSTEPSSLSISLEQPPSFTSIISSESLVSSSSQTLSSSPSQQTSSEPVITDTLTSSLTPPISSSPLSPAASQVSTSTSETVILSVVQTISKISSSSPIQPSQSSILPTSVMQTPGMIPSLSLSSPRPTPSPAVTGCPSLLVEGESIPQSSLVQLRLGLTVSKHSLIAMATSPERCELEEALAVAIFGNADSSAGHVVRRQTSSIYDADITDVGSLSSGTSVITFYIINATDPLATPTFVPAAMVIAAIQSRNLSQVLTYPIIGVEAPPPSSTSLVVPLAAGLGVALFLLVVVAVAMVLCVAVLYYNAHKTIKVETLRGAEAATTFARTDDFGHFSEEQSTSSGAAVTKETVAKKPPVSISQLANGWVEGGEATATLDRETPSSRQEQIPAGLFERVAHYESATPPQPSPSTRALKMKFRNAVAPSPSTSHKSHSSMEGTELIKATPTALRPQRRSGVARETVQSKEDDLRLQEQREEEELKQRRKATLERLMLQSRQRDTEIRSRIGSRRRKRRGSITMETRVRPSTYGGTMPTPRWEPELDAAMGDVDSSSPFATPHPADIMATTPRPTTRPSTKRRLARRKGNKIAPGQTTDDYDSTDHAPHPYHMMMDPRGGSMERKVIRSRTGSRMKHGRSQRGRPFSRDHGRQSTLGVSGRRSRGVAADVQRELAWMDTPGGVQLMRIQPILPAAAVAAPTFALPPPHPSTAGGQLISVQPRLHPKALATPPHPPRHSTLENLPTLAPPSTQNFTHKQLETLWREIEKFQLDQTMRRDSTATGHAPPTKAMPTEQPEAKDTAKSTDAPQTTTSEVGEPSEAGVGGGRGEAESSEDVKSKDKEKTTPQEQSEGAASSQPTGGHATAERPPATPAPPTHMPDIDSSYSSAAAIQELLHQAFSASQSQGGGGGTGQPWAAASSTYQDSLDSGAHLLRLSGGASYHNTLANQQQPPGTAWHSVVTSQPPQSMAPPTQIYAAPPTHYSGLPGQLVWAPPDPHSFTPLHTQVISPAQLTQLRQQSQPTYHHHDYDISYANDPYHTPPPATMAQPHTQQYFSPYSRYRRHDPFS